MGKKHTLVIRSDAAVEFVHSDALLLNGLGEPEIQRLSEVEFEGGEWVARERGSGREIARHRLRSTVIEMERRYFVERQEQGLSLHGEAE